MLQQAPKPLVASDLMSHAIEPWADSATGRALQAAAISFVGQAKRLPNADDWKVITATAALDKVLVRIAKASKPPVTRGAVRGSKGVALQHEAAVAGALQHLANISPATLADVFKLHTVAWL